MQEVCPYRKLVNRQTRDGVDRQAVLLREPSCSPSDAVRQEPIGEVKDTHVRASTQHKGVAWQLVTPRSTHTGVV